MQVSELAATTGVPVATIKYYLREGLLPAGRKVSERLSDYDDSHVRRLGLLRVLREIGDVPVDRLRAIVAAAEDETSTVHEMFAAAADALAPSPAPGGPERPFTRQVADDLISRAGWTNVREDSVDRDNLATVLEAVLAHGTHPPDPEEALPYLELADKIARYEIDALDASRGRVGLLEEMVVGQVVFGQMLLTLRRLAEEHHSAARFGGEGETGPG
jgi:DNA-binding transcriptional MerR regulator